MTAFGVLMLVAKQSDFLDALAVEAEKEGFTVRKESGLPGFEKLEADFPDCILLDFDLILSDEGRFLIEATQKFPSMPIYLLAAPETDEAYLFEAFKQGARGWLFKQDAKNTLTAFAAVLGNRHFLKPFSAEQILLDFKRCPDGEQLLTVEEEILRQAARHLEEADILKNLNLSVKALKEHWESIHQKLIVNARALSSVKARIPVPQTQEKPPEKTERALESSDSAVSSTNTNSLSLEFVSFSAGDEEFAVKITDLQEIQKMLRFTPIPHVPQYILGIANLRGVIIPVVDLRLRLGLPAKALSKDARVMVINLKGKLAGILVDKVNEVLKIDPSQLEAPPALALGEKMGLLEAVVTLDERLILLLDLAKTISIEQESACLI